MWFLQCNPTNIQNINIFSDESFLAVNREAGKASCHHVYLLSLGYLSSRCLQHFYQIRHKFFDEVFQLLRVSFNHQRKRRGKNRVPLRTLLMACKPRPNHAFKWALGVYGANSPYGNPRLLFRAIT